MLEIQSMVSISSCTEINFLLTGNSQLHLLLRSFGVSLFFLNILAFSLSSKPLTICFYKHALAPYYRTTAVVRPPQIRGSPSDLALY